jgi:hypothetical protein
VVTKALENLKKKTNNFVEEKVHPKKALKI